MHTRVKICGITCHEDAWHVVEAGADAIGLVFYEKSPRNVDTGLAAAISRELPPFITRVALFKDAPQEQVEAVLQQVEIDLLQFHGNEAAEYCEQFNRSYMKAIGMKGIDNAAEYLLDAAGRYQQARALLLDGHAPGEDGGSGEAFDWSVIREIEKPLILAGGLSQENVKAAIEIARPYAVDVSSGVESEPGLKDRDKIAAFMQQVRLAGRLADA